MKTTNLSIKVKQQYNDLFQKGIDAINDFRNDGDVKKFQTALFNLVDQTPNVSYLDPDVLSIYGIESERSQWVECDEEEMAECRTNIKDCILSYNGFEDYQLGFGSASILITLWGDTFYKLFRK